MTVDLEGVAEEDEKIFDDKMSLLEDYIPDDIPEREEEAEEIFRIIFDKDGVNESNIFVQGKTGQGKSATVEHLMNQYEEFAAEELDYSFSSIYVDCTDNSTSYNAACSVVRDLTGDNPKGHGQGTVNRKMFDAIENQCGDRVVVVLDEVDYFRSKNGVKDGLLYQIPRARSNGRLEDTYISVIGITNDSSFFGEIDRRAQSSLRSRTITFDSYDAEQLQSILERRVEKAFADDVVDESATRLCSAIAAREQGNARQALNYIYEAGLIASKRGDDVVTDDHVNDAKEKVKEENIKDSIRSTTLQERFALATLANIATDGNTPARTREVFSEGKKFSRQLNIETVGIDRFRENLSELALLGIVSKRKHSGGSAGRPSQHWSIDKDLQLITDALKVDEDIEPLITDI